MSPQYMHSKAAKENPDKYSDLRREQRRRYYEQTADVYPRRKWEAWEDEMVLSDMSVRDLSHTLQRSMKSISNRRWRLKKDKRGKDTA